MSGWSHGGLLELDAAGNPLAADLGVVRIAVNGAHIYRHTDERGNVVMRSDANGEIRTRRTFDAYGPLETFGEAGDDAHGYALGLELPIDASLGPVYVLGERVYVLFDKGFFAAYDARSGKLLYKVRFERGGHAFSSSPWAYAGKIFCLSEDGVTFVIKAGDRFEVLGKNSLDEMSLATPAIANGSLFIRTVTRLYRIQEKGSAKVAEPSGQESR